MQLSHQGIEALKEREGFESKAYKDTGGVWTIGYGTIKANGQRVEQGMECTQAEATQWLIDDLVWAQTAVNKSVKVPLSQHQFDALVSFVYNIGEDAFYKSTMLRKLNAKDYAGAAGEFDRWVMDNGKRVKGLENRRNSEQEQFES